MDTIHQLRKLSVRLEPSGTARIINNTKLYQGSCGFVGLQCYVPKTQLAGPGALCTVHKTSIDPAGNRARSDNYNMVYVEETELDGSVFLLYECLCPREFTEVEGEVELVFNYCATKEDEADPTLRRATAILASGSVRLTVEAGGYNDAGVELDITAREAVQINANTENINQIKGKTAGLFALTKPPDDSEADKVGLPTVTIAEDGRLKFSHLKGEPGVNATVQWGFNANSPVSTLTWKKIGG